MKGLSQSLMEYILLLAIVLILGAVIYVVLTSAGIIEFGVIKSTSRAQSEAYWIAQDIGIQPNYRISSTGIAELTLTNNKQFRIEILGVTLNEKGTSIPSLLALSRGETAEVNVTGFDRSQPARFTATVSISNTETSGLTGRSLLAAGARTLSLEVANLTEKLFL